MTFDDNDCSIAYGARRNLAPENRRSSCSSLNYKQTALKIDYKRRSNKNCAYISVMLFEHTNVHLSTNSLYPKWFSNPRKLLLFQSSLFSSFRVFVSFCFQRVRSQLVRAACTDRRWYCLCPIYNQFHFLGHKLRAHTYIHCGILHELMKWHSSAKCDARIDNHRTRTHSMYWIMRMPNVLDSRSIGHTKHAANYWKPLHKRQKPHTHTRFVWLYYYCFYLLRWLLPVIHIRIRGQIWFFW